LKIEAELTRNSIEPSVCDRK